jgi:hypothetical protein
MPGRSPRCSTANCPSSMLDRGLDNAGRYGAPALLAIALVVLVAAGCGGTSEVRSSPSTAAHGGAVVDSTAPPNSQTARSGGYLKLDGDTDTDDETPSARGNDEGPLLASYGPLASPADTRAITALVKSYYAASVAGDATRVCSLLFVTLADGLAAQPTAGGTHQTCAGPMSLLLDEQHRRLVAEDVPTMRVTTVRVKGKVGLAVLGFRKVPESQIILAREGHAWKIDALFGTYMP